MRVTELLSDLSGGNAPCTVETSRTGSMTFLEKITKGKELSKVRLVIDKGEGSGG